MIVAGYRINVDALVARIVYRWRWRSVLALVIGIASLLLASGLIPPFWRGAAQLTIDAAPGAVVTLDGRPWPAPVYAGAHTVRATLPDGRSAWADLTLTSGEALTITLPSGLAAPRVRQLAPAAPGMRIARVWWAGGAWRMRSVPAPASSPTDTTAPAAPTPYAGQTIAIGAQSERLSTIDAYAGLADQVQIDGALIEAVYTPGARSSGGGGVIEIRGWGAPARPVTVTAPLTLLSFSPQGDRLLLAEATSAGEQVSVVTRGAEPTPLVAAPGQIARIDWRDDGRALVLTSRQEGRLTLTLVRLEPTVVTAALADLDASAHAGDLVPLAWEKEALLWVAPDDGGTPSLWRAMLASPIAERVLAIDARALAPLPDGNLRVLAAHEGQLIIGRYREAQFIGEVVVADVPLADDLRGMWRGDTLMLQSGERAWLLDIDQTQEQE